MIRGRVPTEGIRSTNLKEFVHQENRKTGGFENSTPPGKHLGLRTDPRAEAYASRPALGRLVRQTPRS